MSHFAALGDNRVAALAADLAQTGYAHLAGWLTPDLVAALRAEALSHETALARVGRGTDETRDLRLRRSHIAWLDGSTPAQMAFFAAAEDIRHGLNTRALLGLFEFEACFAIYPPGGFYARHLDSFVGARNRMVSLVTWLNADWTPEDGGALAVWTPEAADTSEPTLRIMPEGGALALLLSEEIPHAVEPPARPRIGIAGWYRVNQSTADRVDPPA